MFLFKKRIKKLELKAEKFIVTGLLFGGLAYIWYTERPDEEYEKFKSNEVVLTKPDEVVLTKSEGAILTKSPAKQETLNIIATEEDKSIQNIKKEIKENIVDNPQMQEKLSPEKMEELKKILLKNDDEFIEDLKQFQGNPPKIEGEMEIGLQPALKNTFADVVDKRDDLEKKIDSIPIKKLDPSSHDLHQLTPEEIAKYSEFDDEGDRQAFLDELGIEDSSRDEEQIKIDKEDLDKDNKEEYENIKTDIDDKLDKFADQKVLSGIGAKDEETKELKDDVVTMKYEHDDKGTYFVDPQTSKKVYVSDKKVNPPEKLKIPKKLDEDLTRRTIKEAFVFMKKGQIDKKVVAEQYNLGNISQLTMLNLDIILLQYFYIRDLIKIIIVIGIDLFYVIKEPKKAYTRIKKLVKDVEGILDKDVKSTLNVMKMTIQKLPLIIGFLLKMI